MRRIAEDEILFTYEEACQYLRVSRSTMHRLLQGGRVAGRKIGKKWLFYKKDLVAAVGDPAVPSPSGPIRRHHHTDDDSSS